MSSSLDGASPESSSTGGGDGDSGGGDSSRGEIDAEGSGGGSDAAPSDSAGNSGDSSGSQDAGAPDAAGDSSVPASFSAWYEAEAIPPNATTNGAYVLTCAGSAQYGRGAACAEGALQEGAYCCSEGKLVVSLLGRADGNAGAGLQFNNVSVPSDGTYDVTWWYHCGANDSYGDVNCGGLHYAVGSSCRPHLIDVNGVTMTSTAGDGRAGEFYQFPCYQGDWSVVHAAKTALPLKAGANIIYIHPPHVSNLDSADIDAIHLTAVGQGTGPTITPVVGNGAD